MERPWVSLGLRSLLCAALSAPLWYYLGPVAALPTVAIWGFMLAEPLMGVTGDLVRRLKAAAYRDVDGSCYVHAGQTIEILETDAARWLRVAQVQRLLGSSAREQVFARRFGPEHVVEGRRGRWFVRDEVLLDYLERSPRALDARRNGLRLFVQHEVMDPHRRRHRMQTGEAE